GATANPTKYELGISNLPLGHFTTQNYQDDPLAQAVERAVHTGFVVVTAAGNFGKSANGLPIAGGVVSPGYDPLVITAGALNTKGTVGRSDDGVTTFSSRGLVCSDATH